MNFSMWKDYISYLFSLKKKESLVVFIDLAIFIASIEPALKQWASWLSGVVSDWPILLVFGLSLLKFSWDVYSILGEMRSYFSIADVVLVSSPQIRSRILPSKREEGLGFKGITLEADEKKEPVLYSKSLNNTLWERELPLVVNSSMQRKIRELTREHADTLVPFLSYQFNHSRRNHKVFVNEQKLCLSTDIDWTRQQPVVCHKGGYYDTFLTNQICGKYLESGRDGIIVADATKYLPYEPQSDGEIRIHDLTTAVMNNEIGISTIGFTADNYFVFWRQNNHAQSSCNLLVPTGSGSCDWADIVETSFSKTITNAMQRELWEESGRKQIAPSPDEVGDTKILGFYRWVKRGGKPEFIGITKLKARYIDLFPNYHEVRKNHNEFENRAYVGSMDDLTECIEDMLNRDDLSVPLQMCLLFLRDFAEQRKEDLQAFMYDFANESERISG